MNGLHIRGGIYMSVCVLLIQCLFPIAGAKASYTADKEYLLSLSRMYSMGMTKFQESGAYNPGGVLLREQAAKFFVTFAKNSGMSAKSAGLDCDFEDVRDADSTLVTYIEDACEYGIIRGSQGSFNPKEVMTKAQALTVLVRIKEGIQNENTSPRWANNFKKAQELGFTKEQNVWAVDVPVSRYEIALLLSRAAGNSNAHVTDPDIDDVIRVVGLITPYLRNE